MPGQGSTCKREVPAHVRSPAQGRSCRTTACGLPWGGQGRDSPAGRLQAGCLTLPRPGLPGQGCARPFGSDPQPKAGPGGCPSRRASPEGGRALPCPTPPVPGAEAAQLQFLLRRAAPGAYSSRRAGSDGIPPRRGARCLATMAGRRARGPLQRVQRRSRELQAQVPGRSYRGGRPGGARLG